MRRSSQLLEVERVVPNALLKTYARLRATYSTSSWDKPIHLKFALLIAFLFLFGCETGNYVPPVTPQMAAASPRNQDVDLSTLRQGRTFFVHRCIECHTLPAIWKYSREDWPRIVNSMSHRASLKAAERDAVIAYILAVRARER